MAQDIHYTQFTNASQLYNPALTGQYEQTVKASILHKRQWRSIGKGYQTNGFDGQYKILTMYSRNYFGTGIMLFQDKAGIAEMKTFLVKASAAYHVVISNNDLFSAGVQVGYVQRSLNADGLAWDAQYNGYSYDSSLDNKESFVNQSKGNADLGIGINWRHSGDFGFVTGYGIRHTRQEISFLARSSEKYAMRHAWNIALAQRVGKMDVKADALIQRQAGAMEIIIGGSLDYRLGMDSRYTNVRTSSVIRGGMYYRLKDAIHPFIGFQYKRTAMISLGYDFRLNKIAYTSGITGGPELSISYLGTLGRTRMRIMH